MTASVRAIPHLATFPDHGWHGRVNDDVRGHVVVMPLSELTMAKSGRDSSVSAMVTNCRAVFRRHGGNLATKSPNPLLKSTPVTRVAMAVDHRLEKGAHSRPKQDRVRHLHHGGLHVQREQIFLVDAFDFAVRNDSKWRMDKAA